MSGIPTQTRYGCYIGNIDRSVTIDMLKQVFCQCGTIIDCSLNGREGDPYRFGFIDFATEDDRARALKYNGFTLVGRKLKVGISKGNVNKPEGFANGNPGSNSSPGHHNDRARQPYGNSGNLNYRGGGGEGMDGAGGVGVNGLTQQQQIEARLLLQLLQEGKMDPRQLSPAQQQLLITSLGQGGGSGNSNNSNNSNNNNNPGNVMLPPPQPAMGNPMMMMMGGGMGPMGVPPSQQPLPGMGMMPGGSMGMGVGGPRMMMDGGMGPHGGYGAPAMMMAPLPHPQQLQRSPQPWAVNMQPSGIAMYPAMGGARQPTPPQQPQSQPQQAYGGTGAGVLSGGGSGGGASGMVNPPPTAETLRLREKQREQFFEVVRKDTEKYERKLQEKRAQAAAGAGGERTDSSASDDDEKPTKKSKKEAPYSAK
jgi:hypothetical protein